MRHSIKRKLAAIALYAWASISNADALTSLSAAAETCRQASIQLEWLSQYQIHRNCSINLSDDALNVFFASKYILANQLAQAQTILNAAIIQTAYTIDIGCDGHANIQSVLVSLQSVLQAIS